MTRADKAERIGTILRELFPLPAVPLRHEDPYTLLIAVILSAQCTDQRVNEVTPRLFARARTPSEMLKLSVPQIRSVIRPCGLAPSKAKHIRALSKLLIESHAGRVPCSIEALEALPGVGHKTASVVMAQAFGESTFPVDTHIQRLAARWGLSNGTSVVRTERDLKRVFPRSEWNQRHLQIIYFGRRYCPARGHDLAACPICAWAASGARIARERRSQRAARRPRSDRLRSR